MQRNYNYIFKIIIVGSSAVGKTSILLRFADDSFEQIYVSTLGVDFRFKSLYFGENFVKLQIWDTAGQQRFRGITNSYYKGSHAVIIVYDANDPKTFDQIKEYWVNEATKFCLPQNIYCVANKCDDPFKTYITLKQTQFCQKNKIKLFGISAKTGYNVKQSINLIVNDLIKKNPKIEQQKLKLELHQNHSTSNDKKCKC